MLKKSRNSVIKYGSAHHRNGCDACRHTSDERCRKGREIWPYAGRRCKLFGAKTNEGMPAFDSNWRKACSVRKCSITEIDKFIRAHYLAKRPAIVLLCLVAEREGQPIGCVVYSAPPREADKRYGGKVWELARVYLLDEIPRNAETWLIGKSVRYIKRHHKDVRHLLSYADPSAGHVGTIYKAANWRQDGRTDDERKTPRCDYYDERTGKKYGRRGNMPHDAVVSRKPRVSKWRFTLAL